MHLLISLEINFYNGFCKSLLQYTLNKLAILLSHTHTQIYTLKVFYHLAHSFCQMEFECSSLLILNIK